jgi:cystathionine gamma-synthase
MKLDTVLVHAGGEPDPATGAVAPPIHLATTFRHGPAGEREAGFEYARESNPTLERLEAALAAAEGGAAAAALGFASGMAAVHALLASLPAGSQVLIPEDVYHGLRVLGREYLPRIGVEVRAVDTGDVAAVRAAWGASTRCVWLETPSNPQLVVSDIAAIAEWAHGHDALVAVDNTFATPVLQQPLALGADVVMHSTTKYLGGHSDVMGGALVFARRDARFDAIARARHVQGAVLSPFSAWLTLRGLRSLSARIERHCRNARALATFLAAHPKVSAVHYPGLAAHRNHAVAARQMRDFGGMLSFRMADRTAALAVAARVRLFLNATSLGGNESLIEHRASVEGAKPHSPPGLLRLSVGLEDADDLMADLAQALDGA